MSYCCSHQSRLEKRVEDGRFRQDLYYRLNVVTMDLPALTERREDIPILAEHFVSEFNTVQGKAIEGISEDVLHVLMRHEFPGNVRELENILEFAFILCPSGFIQVEHLPEHLQPIKNGPSSSGGLYGTMEEIKCRAARHTLARNNGKRMATCRELKYQRHASPHARPLPGRRIIRPRNIANDEQFARCIFEISDNHFNS